MQIAFFPILGKPLIFWLGILTILCFASTYITGLRRIRGNRWAIRWHPRFAHATAGLAVLHGLLGILIYI
jgi:hypothetical protein